MSVTVYLCALQPATFGARSATALERHARLVGRLLGRRGAVGARFGVSSRDGWIILRPCPGRP
jgi:hypothetical protein